MKLALRSIVILLSLEWLFVDGLGRGYAWFSSVPFSLPARVGPFQLVHVFVLLAVLALVALVFLISRLSPGWLGFRKPSVDGWRDLWLALAFVFPISFIGRFVVPDFDGWYADRSGFLVAGLLGGALLSIFLAVVKEELLERTMQRLLLDAYGPVLVSAAGALQFGIAHFFAEPLRFGLASALSVVPVAFVLALLYAKTRNIWLTLCFHLAFNAAVVLQIILHANSDVVGEALFWLVWGFAWLLTLKAGWRFVREASAGPRVRMRLLDWLFLGAFALGVPLALIVLG